MRHSLPTGLTPAVNRCRSQRIPTGSRPLVNPVAGNHRRRIRVRRGLQMNDPAREPARLRPETKRIWPLASGRLVIVTMAVLGVVGAFILAGVSPPVAHAVCPDPPCHKIPDAEPAPDSPPATTTTISEIAPRFAWSGDTIVVTGTGFTGAT